MKDQKVVIVDVDGTLSNNDHRQRFLDKEKYSGMTEDDRWECFFSLCFLDSPKIATIETVTALYKAGHRIVIFTGRPEKYREPTREWLNFHQVPFSALYMRPDEDRAPDHEVKEKMLSKMYMDSGFSKHDVMLVLDDRQSVVDMWRRLGLTCFQVAPGDF